MEQKTRREWLDVPASCPVHMDRQEEVKKGDGQRLILVLTFSRHCLRCFLNLLILALPLIMRGEGQTRNAPHRAGRSWSRGT